MSSKNKPINIATIIRWVDKHRLNRKQPKSFICILIVYFCRSSLNDGYKTAVCWTKVIHIVYTIASCCEQKYHNDSCVLSPLNPAQQKTCCKQPCFCWPGFRDTNGASCKGSKDAGVTFSRLRIWNSFNQGVAQLVRVPHCSSKVLLHLKSFAEVVGSNPATLFF